MRRSQAARTSAGQATSRAALADFDERADDRADHVVEEAVAGDFDA